MVQLLGDATDSRKGVEYPLSKGKLPANGDVVRATWADGSSTIAYRNQNEWHRWDRDGMIWNASAAPMTWGHVHPEDN